MVNNASGDDLQAETEISSEVGDTGRFGPAVASALGTCTLIFLQEKCIPWANSYSASPEGPVSGISTGMQFFTTFGADLRSLKQHYSKLCKNCKNPVSIPRPVSCKPTALPTTPRRRSLRLRRDSKPHFCSRCCVPHVQFASFHLN